MTKASASVSLATSNIPFRAVASSRVFELILFPTEKCNFRCVYCYEKFDAGKMKPSVVAGIKNLVANRASELDSLHISWFGGEPLLAKDIMREVCTECRDQSRAYGFKYQSSAVTNGYLLDIETAVAFYGLGIREYQITLDGPQEVHNEFRRKDDDDGTYERIIYNLDQIKESDIDIKIKLRLHFSPDNYRYMDDFIDHLLRRYDVANDRRFQPYLHAICKWGGPNDDRLNVFSDVEYQSVYQRLAARLGEREYGDYICYAAKANSLLIRSDGRIGKCTVALYDDRNTIGTLDADGSVNIDGTKMAPWVKGIIENNMSYMACPYSHIKEVAKA
jgi:uncharacterized protein